MHGAQVAKATNALFEKSRIVGRDLHRQANSRTEWTFEHGQRAQGMGMLKIARVVKVGSGTVQRVLGVKNA